MYDRILVAMDYSKMSERALLAARDLALLSHGEVWVLHLREREIMAKGGADIVQDAREHDIDVIVMGSPGRTDLAGLVLGSTAHKVIHLADRPVLVVR